MASTKRSIDDLELELESLEKEINQGRKKSKAEWLKVVAYYNALKIRVSQMKGLKVTFGYYNGEMNINPINRI